MRTIAMTAAVVCLWSGSVHAQSIQQRQEERGQTVDKTPLQIEREERARQAHDVEKEYEAAMKRSTAAPKVVVDPWGSVRPNPSGDKK